MKKLITLAGGMLAVALLSGCTSAQSTDATPTPTATESTRPTASATPSPQPTEQPTEAPAATVLDCTDAVTQAGHDQLASNRQLPQQFKYLDWDYPILERFAADGVVCEWGYQGDSRIVLGQLALSEAEWADVRASLLEAGFVEDDSVMTGFLDGPDDPAAEPELSFSERGVVYRDGILYYSSFPGFFKFVTAFQA